MKPLIKVCGMRDADNIRQVEALGIDLMGFIFWPPSSRYVSERPAYLPTQCRRVGVFVDETIAHVCHLAADYALDVIQLHGHETPEYVRTLRNTLNQHNTQETPQPKPRTSDIGHHPSSIFHLPSSIIKAFSVATVADLSQTADYEGLVDAFLFDTKGKLAGGNGQQFDWDILADYKGDTPFLLSGGIGPADADRLRQFRHPRCIGIDLNSRFETAPAVKNPESLAHFLGSLGNPRKT